MQQGIYEGIHSCTVYCVKCTACTNNLEFIEKTNQALFQLIPIILLTVPVSWEFLFMFSVFTQNWSETLIQTSSCESFNNEHINRIWTQRIFSIFTN